MPDHSEAPKILILGTGIAGLSAALRLSKNAPNAEVTLVSKTDPVEGATRYAQGGIAAVWSGQDSFSSHIGDTLKAGVGLCHEDVVEICVREGPDRVRELIEDGVEFTIQDDSYDLHREGGHSERRILHADDLTGLAIEEALLRAITQEPRIALFEHFFAIDVITLDKLASRKKTSAGNRVVGLYALDVRDSRVVTFHAPVVMLSTGGAGQVYLYTTNPDIATGDGIAMAYRAGVEIRNMEFTQFHPTALFHPQARRFLISDNWRKNFKWLNWVLGRQFDADWSFVSVDSGFCASHRGFDFCWNRFVDWFSLCPVESLVFSYGNFWFYSNRIQSLEPV